MQTTIKLSELKNNPMRDFRVDPLDEERIEMLQASISEDGFWGGVVCRRSSKGELQIAAGHHRIEAARRAGIEEASLYVVPDMTDEAMIRVYARENATQRGQIGTAQAGSVAAAVRYLAKEILTVGDQLGGEFPTYFEEDGRSRKPLLGEEGLGRKVIVRFLNGVPGINDETVKQQLANLKSSGEYARLINEVYEEIEQERLEAEQKLVTLDYELEEAQPEEVESLEDEAGVIKARAMALKESSKDAKKASEAAGKQKKIFDFIGVSKHLKMQAHVEEFRDIVTSEKGVKYVHWSQQAPLAEELVKAAARDHESNYRVRLTAAYIRSNAWAMLDQFDDRESSNERKRKAEIQAKDWEEKAKAYQRDFARGIRLALGAAHRLGHHKKNKPDKARGEVELESIGEFRRAIENARRILKLLDEIAPEQDIDASSMQIEAEILRLPAA